jgi:hypothetical protein
MKKLKLFTLLALLAVPLAACDDDDVTVAPPVEGTVRGTVTIEGQPAAGITVSLSGAASRTATTNASGGYEFTAVAEGGYEVGISGFASDVSFPTTSRAAVINTAGQQVTVDFSGQFIRTSSISVSVAAGGSGIPGVTISLTGAGSATAQTGAAGQYTFTGLRAGEYTVAISGVPAGVTFGSQSQTVTVGVGQNATVGFDGNRPSTSSVAISSITNAATGLPVNPSAVAGQINVTLAVNPGNDTPEKLEAFVNDEKVYEQTFTQAVLAEMAEEAGEAPFNVTFSVLTNEYTVEDGVATVRFPNGVYSISAQFETVEGGETGAVQTETNLTFANADIVDVAVEEGASALDMGGLQWVGQGVTATFTHVAYSGNAATNFNSSFGGLARSTNPAVWTAANLAGFNSTAAGSNLTVNTIVAGNPGPSATVSLRYDGVAPAVGTAAGLANDFTLTEQIADGVERCCSNNWVNPGYEFDEGAPSASDVVGGIAGVGGLTTTYHAGAASLTNAQLAALAAAETPGGAGLAASAVNTTYSVVARVADALGNFTLQRLVGDGVNPGTTFGHDATPPTDQEILAGSVEDRTIYNVNVPGFGAFAAGTIDLSAVDNVAGFGLDPVATNFRYTNAADGITCLVGATAACVPTQQGLSFATDNTDIYPGAGAVTEGYYQYRGEVYDQAGLGTGTTSIVTYLFDETAPNVNNIQGTAGSFLPGQSYSFSATATDNVDLLQAQFSLVFPGLTGTNLDAVPLGGPEMLGTPWDFDNLTTTATPMATVPFITGVEPTDGAGAPSGVLVPVGFARFVVTDVAQNQSTQQNNFVVGSFPAPVSFAAGATPLFPAGATFQQTTAAVDLCFNAEEDCTAPEVRTVTLTATATGTSGTFQNPFDLVLFAYVDNIDVGGGEFTHRFIGIDGTATVQDDGVTRTWTWSTTLAASDLVLDPAGLDYVLPVQAIGVNATTGTALLAVTGTAVTVIDN